MTSIAQLLAESRIIAVVGLSTNSGRSSHQIAEYLQEQGYRIVPVNPTYAGQHILGQRCYATLTEAAAAVAPERIDIVDCFRKSEDIFPIAQEAVQIKAGCLWMQLDVVNQAAADLAAGAGLTVVMDRCLRVEHASLLRATQS